MFGTDISAVLSWFLFPWDRTIASLLITAFNRLVSHGPLRVPPCWHFSFQVYKIEFNETIKILASFLNMEYAVVPWNTRSGISLATTVQEFIMPLPLVRHQVQLPLPLLLKVPYYLFPYCKVRCITLSVIPACAESFFSTAVLSVPCLRCCRHRTDTTAWI